MTTIGKQSSSKPLVFPISKLYYLILIVFSTITIFRNDLPDVLHYLISMKKIDPYQKDAQDRTLVFLAVMNEKPKILTYLVKRVNSHFKIFSVLFLNNS